MNINTLRKAKLVAITILLLNLVGCAKSPNNYAPKVSNFSKPEIGLEVTAGLGETLLTQGLSVQQEIIEIPHQIEWSISGMTVPVGKYPKTGEDKVYKYYSTSNTSHQWVTRGAFDSIVASGSILVRKKDNVFCVSTNMDILCEPDDQFKIGTDYVQTNDSYQQTLIYSGRVGNKLRMSYREFSNNMARNAFSVDVEYDLNDGNIIGYKGAKLEILESTNTSITYKVLSNFN